MAVVAAALPLLLPLAEKGIQAQVELAKSAMAQISEALRTPMWGYETTSRNKAGTKVTVRKGSVPAWFIVGAAIGIPVGMWILGLGVTPKRSSDGSSILAFTERPRLTLPFAPQAGGQASSGFIPDWVPFFGQF